MQLKEKDLEAIIRPAVFATVPNEDRSHPLDLGQENSRISARIKVGRLERHMIAQREAFHRGTSRLARFQVRKKVHPILRLHRLRGLLATDLRQNPRVVTLVSKSSK